MSWQKDDIEKKAKDLGLLDNVSSSQLENMQHIASQLGMDDFNGLSNADTDELERRIKEYEKQQALAKQNNQQANNDASRKRERNNSRNASSTKNPQKQNAAQQYGKKVAKKAVSSALQSYGVPQGISEKISESDIVDKAITMQMNKSTKKIKLIVILIAIILCSGFIFVAVLFSDEDNATSGTSSGAKRGDNGVVSKGSYTSSCDEITVVFTDKNKEYQVTGTSTYDLEEYVAGVIYGEVGVFNNEEIFKTFAIAARTYGLDNVDETCTIESSDRKQVFHNISTISNSTVDLAREAANATKGQVLISENKLYAIQYDAFCSIAKDDNYYTIKQKKQKIPVDWAEKQGMPSNWLEGTCSGNHGRGMSQYGAYYLASEQSYTAEEILSYYYGDKVSIAGPGRKSTVTTLNLKDTRYASNTLDEPLSNFLAAKGSSVSEYNQYIYTKVIDNGLGTREGVVAAAMAMINYLYDNYDTKLPYYWGGAYQNYGVDSTFGSTEQSSEVSKNGNYYYIKSFDCSGFVSWAIKNGGYNFTRLTTVGFDDKFSSDSCDITSTNCIGEPGDLINSRNGHVELIVEIDEEAGVYFVAQASNNGVVINARNMHQGDGDNTKILHLKEFYENPANKASDYPQ